MKIIVPFIVGMLISLSLFSQELTADDRVTIIQSTKPFVGVYAFGYQGLPTPGYPQFQLNNYGGVPGTTLATADNSILGLFAFSGHNGSAKKTVGIIRVKSMDNFASQLSSRLDFLIGPNREQRMTILGDSGYVGIGTETPTSQLDVNGQIRMQTGATAGYIPVSDADGVMNWTDPSSLSLWSESGADIYRPTGKVDIGPISPYNDNALDVNSYGPVSIGINANSNNGTNIRTAALILKTNASLDDQFFIKKYGSGETTSLNGLSLANMSVVAPSETAGSLYMGTYGDHPVYLASAGEIAMYFDTDQDVGVNTQIPNAQFHVSEGDGDNMYVIRGESSYTGDEEKHGVYGKSVNNPGYGIGGYFKGGKTGCHALAEGTTFTGQAYAVRGIATGTAGSRTGVFGQAINAGGNSAYGVYGNTYGNCNTNYGIFGTATGGVTNWAGYFVGNIRVTGTIDNTSDAKLKRDIEDMDGALDIIKQLQAKTYSFKTDEYPHMMLDERPQLGFIAQDMEKVLPQLVRTAIHPEHINQEGEDTGIPNAPEVDIKSINYIGIIPLLTQGIKELTTEVEEKDEVIKELQTELADVKKQLNELADLVNSKFNQVEDDMTSCCLNDSDSRTGSTNTNIELNGTDLATLEQNAPNPFNEQTIIKYYIPSSAQKASLSITDIKGSILKSVNLNKTGIGTLTIHANELPVGTYIYTLFIDGKKVESKQMVLVK